MKTASDISEKIVASVLIKLSHGSVYFAEKKKRSRSRIGWQDCLQSLTIMSRGQGHSLGAFRTSADAIAEVGDAHRHTIMILQ